ncbi:Phosphatidylinositol trisphosphate 3-phosphatase and dual-specificity protein phosphatase [Spathaspora sp. JA1]|nr:Phosphatidylinositol trisphosphate 3-phosphatase and dual-specificity protein phosphatase [Spathaspora sp. JA1]
MKSILRSIISSPKQTYYDKSLGIQYDLSYITPQLVVSSAPVVNYLQQYYRYPLSDLLTILNTHHSHWKLFNFRGEDPGYTDEQVSGRVCHFPFPDHQPPSFDILITCVDELYDFLQPSENVAVLHCKAGKGRSGTLCCAYLMYVEYKSGQEVKVQSVIDLFTTKRMAIYAGDGISILSQRRYLEYWKLYLTNGEQYRVYPVEIYKIRVVGDVANLEISTYIKQQQGSRTNTVTKLIKQLSSANTKSSNQGDSIYFTFPPIKLQSMDIRITVKWCYIWFNIYFESLSNTSYTFKWEDLDGFKGTRQRGVKLFDEIEVYWR